MKKKLFVLIFFLIVIFYYFFLKNNKIINQEEALSAFYVISLLSKEEFDDAHIKGSIYIQSKQIKHFLKKIQNKEVPIIFYANNYYSSIDIVAARNAVDLGFLNVYVYKGGMASWYQASKNGTSGEYFYEGEGKFDYLKIVIIPEAELLDLQEFEEYTRGVKKFKLISTNNLQKILKEGKL